MPERSFWRFFRRRRGCSQRVVRYGCFCFAVGLIIVPVSALPAALLKVKQASRLVGLELGSFHKGLHIPDDIRNLGEPPLCNFRCRVVPRVARYSLSPTSDRL
ncbi:unnamed protein product [Ectocarpus sp. 12 AP-2014]